MKTIDMTDKEMASSLSTMPGWRWARGMLFIPRWRDRYTVCRVRDDGWLMLTSEAWGNTLQWYNPAAGTPALDCPSTVGHLLDALGEGWSVRHDPDRTTAEVYTAWCPGIGRGDGSTRARACADALLKLGRCPGWEVSA
tara:strand:+ start:48 stop:464 length:417 start_codon:yes stop_codon:yes gene_type:complete